MLGWIAKTVFSSVLGHLVLYLVAGGACFYFGYLYATQTSVAEIESVNKELVEIRAERNEIEQRYYMQAQDLKESLNAFQQDDVKHRREIDALKRIQNRGCILSEEELRAHPYTPRMRDGFIGRVH